MQNAREILQGFWQGKTIHPGIEKYFCGITSRTASEAVSDIIKYLHEVPYPYQTAPLSSDKLVEISTNFHTRANTLSEVVLSNMKCLLSHKHRIKISHQMNIFFSMGILGQFILLEQIRKKLQRDGIEAGNLFVAIDYDCAEDSRFRVAHFPNIKSKTGFIPLTGAVNKELFNKPMKYVPKPPEILVRSWLDTIRYNTNENISILKKYKIFEREKGIITSNMMVLQDLVWESYTQAESFVEFNAFLISKVINIIWNLPISFVFGSELQPLMKNGYEHFLDRYNFLNSYTREAGNHFSNCGVSLKGVTDGNSNKFPLWYNCPKCHDRVELKLIENEPIKVEAICQSCNSYYSFNIGNYLEPNFSPISERMSARIVLDNILDTCSLGAIGGTGYLGQADHLVITNYVSERLNMKMSPQCIFTPTGLYDDAIMCRVAAMLGENGNQIKLLNHSVIESLRYIFSSKATFLYFVIYFGIKELHDLWCIHYNDYVMEENVKSVSSYSPFAFSNDVVNAKKELIKVVF